VLFELLRISSPGFRDHLLFDNRRHTHAASGTDGHQATSSAGFIENLRHSRQYARASSGKGVTDGDTATFDVEPGAVDAA
jgi:hypothetical protein